MVEAIDRLGGDELEDYGVRGVLPAKDGAKDTQHAAVGGENIRPDGLARFVGDVQRDKVRARGGRAAFERDGDGDAVEHAAKDDVEQGFAQNRLE